MSKVILQSRSFHSLLQLNPWGAPVSQILFFIFPPLCSHLKPKICQEYSHCCIIPAAFVLYANESHVGPKCDQRNIVYSMSIITCISKRRFISSHSTTIPISASRVATRQNVPLHGTIRHCIQATICSVLVNNFVEIHCTAMINSPTRS